MFLPQYSWWLVAFYLVIPIHSAPVAHPAHTGNAADLAGGDMDPELSPDQFEGDMLGFIVLPVRKKGGFVNPMKKNSGTVVYARSPHQPFPPKNSFLFPLQGANRFDTAVDDENKRWKNGVVPYVISDEYCKWDVRYERCQKHRP